MATGRDHTRRYSGDLAAPHPGGVDRAGSKRDAVHEQIEPLPLAVQLMSATTILLMSKRPA